MQRIKRLVRAGLAADALISVFELPCGDPACSGPATRSPVIGFDLIRRVLVVHRPAVEIVAADLDARAGCRPAGTDPGLT
ncbi:MAG: hypothetical protein ACK4S2_14680 [Gemmobacter sp.]|uniref:hypothetical protein n=1 Tax=Gemmobacter sp. TaxID=1898957 RepID=UPI00391BD86B